MAQPNTGLAVPGLNVPGIRFVAESPRPLPTLPRMDVAGFVGFAAAGPIGIPVAVEDEARFREVFGGDLTLARDAAQRRTLTAHLPPAVRAFFRAGGRRAWVLRVADADEAAGADAIPARTQTFAVPGLLVRTGDGWTSGWLTARSPGSWADRLQLEPRAVRLALGLGRAVFEGTEGEVRVSGWRDWRRGDLLRLGLGGEQGGEAGILFARVDGGGWTDTQGNAVLPVTGLLRLEPTAAPESTGGGVSARLFDGRDDTLEVEVSADDAGGYTLELGGLPAPQPGTLLALTTDDGEYAALVESTRTIRIDTRRVQVELGAVWRLRDFLLAEDEEPAFAERLTFDLHCFGDQGRRWSLERLCLDPTGPRAWTRLPCDRELFPVPDATMPREPDPERDAFHAETDTPRFPLAGPAKTPSAAVPLGMAMAGGVRGTALGDADPGTALERNGLSTAGARLFLDERLKGDSAASLPAEAFHWRYRPGDVPLAGMHALYYIDEISLLAMPDVLHAGWGKVTVASDDGEPALGAPRLDPLEYSDGASPVCVWSRVDGADAYRVQAAPGPTFAEIHQDLEVAAGDPAAPKVSAELEPTGECLPRIWVRVRAEQGSRFGPWSNTRTEESPALTFSPVEQFVPGAALLQVTVEPGASRYTLSWRPILAARAYALEEALRPDFADAVVLTRQPEQKGGGKSFEILRPVESTRYYRVRAEFCDHADHPLGPWSNTVSVVPPSGDRWQEATDDDSVREARDERLQVHAAALRMAAARGDLVVLITHPREYQEDEVQRYRTDLLARFSAEGTEPGYGIQAHPWTLRPLDDGEVRATPPDGAVLGEYAVRTLAIGAWAAPANRAMPEVLGLWPRFESDAWARLYADAINLIRPVPDGFALMSAETLSTDRATRPVNVRRLLILLRKLALREGHHLVFEPNNASFRRRVQRRFERILGDLYKRGAFRGASAAEAFQVVVDESVNPAGFVEQGRFVVELRVAPSLPIAFLTVRLVHTGASGLSVEVI